MRNILEKVDKRVLCKKVQKKLIFPVIGQLCGDKIDQEQTFVNLFQERAYESFTYHDFISTRDELIKVIHNRLSYDHKDFMLSFEETRS